MAQSGHHVAGDQGFEGWAGYRQSDWVYRTTEGGEQVQMLKGEVGGSPLLQLLWRGFVAEDVK